MTTSYQESSTIKVADVDTRWPYRAGYPRLCPQPVGTRYLPEGDRILAEVDIHELRRQVKKILDQHSITLRASTWENISDPIQIAYRAYDHELDKPANLRLLVDCPYDKEENETVKWAEAVLKLHQVVRQLASQVTGIEIFDREYMRTCRICEPPSSSQDFVPEWEREGGYRQQVLKIFDDYPQMFQVMIPIGLRAVGQKAYDHTTVIYFQAIHADDKKWDEIQTKLQSILPDNIGIEIRQGGGSFFLHNLLDRLSLKSYLSLAEVRRPGCRISLQTPQDSTNEAWGTMGGYVRTKPRESSKTVRETIYGVTNGHVVLEPDAAGRHNVVTRTTQAMLSNPAIDIQSPPEKYRHDLEEKLATAAAKLRQEIARRQEIHDAELERDSRLSRSCANYIAKNRPLLEQTEICIRILQQNPHVGPVAAIGFGRREYLSNSIQHQLMMDVGLINLNPSFGKNPQNELYFPEEDYFNGGVANCNTWSVEGLGKDVKVVAKLGRVGSRSWGIVNSFRADIMLPLYVNNVGGPRIVSGWAVSTPWPWAKDSVTMLNSEKPVEHFALPGESGSFIVASARWSVPDNELESINDIASWLCPDADDEVFVVGLLFAGNQVESDLGYFIPFDAVKKEIEDLTGEEMVWPRDRSNIPLP